MLVNWTDVLDGAIVNAAWAVAGMVAKPRASRRVSAAMDTAAWADTERLIRDALSRIAADDPKLPDLTDAEAAGLAAALKRHEVQGALRTLLAARLTDAPETDADQARTAVRLALSSGAALPPGDESASARFAEWLSDYFDNKICGLAATLKGRVGFGRLAQVRAEAYNARIVALLGAIERQLAALADPARRTPAEGEFLQRYRRQAHLQHGFLIPPDFDRRRRIPVVDIYVPARIGEEGHSERVGLTPETKPDSLTVWDLVERLDRTVLLGDPGGGKTTAAKVLTDHFAGDAARPIPFLVTLREYAASAPIEWSVAEHIGHNLRALYQLTVPDGLVERLLLTGRAVVIFDGLDELLDTARRRDVSDRVEQFCAAYPLTPVLVTSRVVGYDQARLDDAQFDCYRLGGFGDDDVTEYARKWFVTQEGVAAMAAEAKAKAFLAESANAKDLRSNPLLLSLMCILYRGAGSLPGDRAGVYARCAELLLRKWDEQRDLYRQVRADHLVEPTIRYLAWWLFTREGGRTETTELDLRAKSAEFLLGRGYECEDEARAAAQEFIDFCRDRMWVFSEVGSTAQGEKLYAFTHQTFMEYFTAGHLAATSDTPEELALAIAPHVNFGEWPVVGELAIQIKQGGTDRAADRIYAALLDQRRVRRHHHPRLLEFLAACVPSTRPSPATVRGLTSAMLDNVFASPSSALIKLTSDDLMFLLSRSPGYEPFIYDELTTWIAAMTTSADLGLRRSGLQLVLEMARWFRRSPRRLWVDEQISRYGAEILELATQGGEFRALAVSAGIISIEQALAMPGDLSVLLGDRELVAEYQAKLTAGEESLTQGLATIGRFLVEHPRVPWVRAPLYDEPLPLITMQMASMLEEFKKLDEFTGLGLAAAIAIGSELSEMPTFRHAYRLSELPMPTPFRMLFRDWTSERVEFAEITDR
ncbi:MAG: NACHT domain-containing protein [Trebonia sp.]